LRFWNNEVLANTEGVLEVIQSPSPYTPPLKGGEISRNLPSKKGKLWMVPTEKPEKLSVLGIDLVSKVRYILNNHVK